MSKPPDWWLKQREPRFGCADVTIVAVAAIAAFVILILILGRADFSTILERVPFGNAATATPGANRSGGITSDDTATAIVNAALTPISLATTRTPATNSPNRSTTPAAVVATNTPTIAVVSRTANIKTACSVHRGDKPSVGTPSFQSIVGWRVELDGKEDNIDGLHWYEIEVTDITAGQYNQQKGWIVDNCVTIQ